LQRNHFFLFAEMYIGTPPEPIELELSDEEYGEEEPILTTPWMFDFGLDKTAEFHQNSGPTLHWNDEIQQTRFIDQWIDLTKVPKDKL